MCRCRRSRCFAPKTSDAVDARIPPTVLSVGTGVEAVCAQIVYYIIQSDFIPSGLFSTVLAGDVSMLQKPFRFALADMTNSVKLVSADDLWVFFV